MAKKNWPWFYAIAMFAGALWLMGLMWTGPRAPIPGTHHTVAMPAAITRGGGGEGKFSRGGSPALFIVYVTPLEAALAGLLMLNFVALGGVAVWHFIWNIPDIRARRYDRYEG